MEKAMQDALESVERIEREGTADPDGEPEVEIQLGDDASDETEPDDDEGDEVAQAAPEPSPDEIIAALKDQLLRLAADFENFRKRARRDQEDMRKFGVENVMRDMLPVLDNLERALQHAGTDNPIVQGVQMVAKQLTDVMATYGVRGFDALGQPFDPERHEAVGQIPSGDAEPGSVLEQLEKGYVLHERLLKPARVLVAAPPLPADGETSGDA